MGVKVSAGYHNIIFRYFPVNFKMYMVLFLAAAAAFLFFAAVWACSPPEKS
jgi:quinol-cytochrome oxidoreductase complex cytochrome b subunit